MRASKERTLPAVKCCKIIRPTSAAWLGVGPLDDTPTLIRIHRYNRRTIECLDDPCPFCESFLTKEERLFLPVLFSSPARRAVLEVPATHLERLQGWATMYHTLRSITLECRRTNGRPNGPIEWRVFVRASGERAALPGWDWMAELSETWRANTVFALSRLSEQKSSVDVHV
jgi:hypothetical protein